MNKMIYSLVAFPIMLLIVLSCYQLLMLVLIVYAVGLLYLDI